MRISKYLLTAGLVAGIASFAFADKPALQRNANPSASETIEQFPGDDVTSPTNPPGPGALAACSFNNNQAGTITTGTLATAPNTVYAFWADPTGDNATNQTPGCNDAAPYPFLISSVTPTIADASLFGLPGTGLGDLTYSIEVRCAVASDFCSGPGALLFDSGPIVLNAVDAGFNLPVIPVNLCVDSPVYIGMKYISWTGDPARVPSLLWDSAIPLPAGRGMRSLNGGTSWAVHPGANGWYDFQVDGNTQDACVPVGCAGQPPLNDDCVDAIGVGDGNNPFANTGATNSGPDHGAGSLCEFAFGVTDIACDVWFAYTATCTGVATIDTSLSTELSDTKMAVYDGVCPVVPADAPLACDDDGGTGFLSSFQIGTVSGNTYYIRVGSYSPDGVSCDLGCGTLRIACAPDLPGACCENGVCTGDVLNSQCNGTWHAFATCDQVANPNKPLAVCTQAECGWDNGGPLDDGGSPSSQEFTLAGDPAGDNTIIEAFDDFILEGASPNPCRITRGQFWTQHHNLPAGAVPPINPNVDWLGGVFVAVTTDTTNPTGHVPAGGSDGIGGCPTCVCYQQQPMGGGGYTAVGGLGITGCSPASGELWDVVVTLDCTLQKNTHYWIAFLPGFDFRGPPQAGQTSARLSDRNSLYPARQAFLTPIYNVIAGNTGLTSAGDPDCLDLPVNTRKDLAFNLLGEKCQDCNLDGICDDDQLMNNDCNNNGIPDDCETDTDTDGVIDDCDNCVDDANPGQEDADMDGAGDACDGCPQDPGKVDPGECGCGVPDDDTDLDGVADCNDGCPQDPNKVQPGICGCGNPETGDTDGDGVSDCVDECPGVDDAVFAPGCQGAIPTVSEWGLVVFALLLLVAGKVYFGRREQVA